jgi:hypothetical protein
MTPVSQRISRGSILPSSVKAGSRSPLGLNHLLVDVRYVQGLVKIERQTDIKNRGFTFGLGFMMPAGN